MDKFLETYSPLKLNQEVDNLNKLISRWVFPCGSAGKESTCNAADLSLIPALGRSPGEGKGYPLQYSSLENSTDYSP